VIETALQEEPVNSMPSQMLPDRREDFENVASRYSRVLFSVALLRLRNVEDAEDAVQDALLSAYKNIGQFEGRSQLSSWLTRIVINAAGMKLRSRPRQEIVSLDQAPVDGESTLANELVDARPNPETVCAQTEMDDALRTALARVSSKLRVAFQLREIAGYSTREAAQALGVTTNTLKSRVSRARVAIGSHLRKVEAAKPADEWKPPTIKRTANTCHHRDVRLAAD
jgi:RNA polymerase sigma-70 factor (ECF subfamily)